MKMLPIVILRSALQKQKSPIMEINEIIDLLMSDLQPNQSTQYLTQTQLAQLFNVDIKTIRNWSRMGKLKFHKYGTRIFFKRHELINVNANIL